MARVDLYFKDKFKVLKKTYSDIFVMSNDIKIYLDKNIPNRFRSVSNLFNLTINVVKDISTLHLLRQEVVENELNIFTATNEGNIRGIAQYSGHQPVLPISSRGVVRMVLKSSSVKEFGKTIILDANATFNNNENGLEYSLLNNVSVKLDTASPYTFLNLVEGTRKKQSFIVDNNSNSVGDNLYTINLDDNEYIEHYSIKVYVNNELWKKEDSLIDMGSDEKVYFKRVGFGNQIDILFGNSVNGKKLQKGDAILIEYLSTNGENGNVNNSSTFELVSGLQDINSNDINATLYFEMVQESGFNLGSNGESSDVTRAMAGYSSRSLTFARPEYLKAYLSRLSVLSYIDAWTLNDDMIFYILALPKLVLKTPRDYFTIDEKRMLLSDTLKTSIKGMINASRRQFVSTEIVFSEPIVKRYGIFIFIDNSIIHDKLNFKNRIENTLAEIMLSKTFGDSDKDVSNDLISRSEFVNAIHEFSEVNAVNVDILSEENELSKINKYYYKDIIKVKGSINIIDKKRIELLDDEDHHLGLSDIGDITTIKREIPIIRGGFKIYQEDGTIQTFSDKGVVIFVRENNNWVNI